MHLKCCRCENYELIQTRSAFSKILNRYYFESVCTDCGEIERKRRSKSANERVKAEKQKKMQKAFLAKRWEGINMDSLEYLIIIAESNSVSEVFKKIFPEKDFTTEHGKKKWTRLNYLESLDLIWIERDSSKKIIGFHILHKLETILREKHPDLFIQKNKKNATILEFELNKDNHLKKYKTKVPLRQNVYLYRDTGYFCQIEILEDGNILFLLKEE